jgi:hypothetical protein
MMSNLQIKSFTAVPHLETSQLMLAHPKGLKFSKTKPNVIFGVADVVVFHGKQFP